MSHDQKPGKMRVVGSSASRRRGDVVPAAAGAAGAAGTAAGAVIANAPVAPARMSPVLLIIMFVIGCALGGAALPFLGVL